MNYSIYLFLIIYTFYMFYTGIVLIYHTYVMEYEVHLILRT